MAAATYLTKETSSDQSAAKRRKIRKGTHSCLECRRRKVKCVYATDCAICTICERRGAKCVSQCDSSGLLNAVDANSRDSGSDSDSAIAIVDDRPLVRDTDVNLADSTHTDEPKELPGTFKQSESEALPTSSVHWSTAAGRKAQHPRLNTDLRIRYCDGSHLHQIVDDFALPEAQAHAATREALLRALPCDEDIGILSRRVSVISAVCYQSDYKSHGLGEDRMPKQQIPVRSLLHPERHPTLLARQMLLFAAAVQHLPLKEVIPDLSEHHHVIMKGLAESAIKLVNTDDALLGTLEGLENLIFEMFYHIDCGNIRRAWITTRRAVTAAQMLNLHRPGHYRFMLIKDESDLEPEIMWSTIVSMERMLSLLLGLPTSTGHMTLAFQTITSDSALGHNLSALVGKLTAKILERNQVESAKKALDMTGEIDREIILAAVQMPSAFWRPLAFTGLEKDSLKALSETRRAFGHMCYYSLVVQLHLPHMLCPHDASQRVYSKIACVNASREILTREIELRTFNPISACCRMSDFLTLIAGMALMLGHATSHGGNEWDHALLAHQRLGDRATVERALECIDPMSDLNEDVLAVRCAALLRDLLAIEEDAAQLHSLRASLPHEMKLSQSDQRHILIMRVPYYGSIRISGEGVAALPATRTEQARSLSEGVTIGGIGSILVGRPNSSDSSEYHGTAHVAVLPTSPTSVTHDPGLLHSAERNTPVISAGSLMRTDLMFPDPVASFDDWVFQGVDTAFMETLMRGSAAPLSDDLGDESWNVSTFP